VTLEPSGREAHRVRECLFDNHCVSVRFVDDAGENGELHTRRLSMQAAGWGLLVEPSDYDVTNRGWPMWLCSHTIQRAQNCKW